MSGGPQGTPPPLDLQAVAQQLAQHGHNDTCELRVIGTAGGVYTPECTCGHDAAQALLAHTRALESKLVAARAGIPRWYEVDQGGEIFGWKLPDEHGCCRVVPAPREVEAFTAAVLGAAQDGPA